MTIGGSLITNNQTGALSPAVGNMLVEKGVALGSLISSTE